MGFEYKIIVSLSESDKNDINELFSKQITKESDCNYKTHLKFEYGGIYVCKYDKPDIWHGLEYLRNLLINRNLKFEVEEM